MNVVVSIPTNQSSLIDWLRYIERLNPVSIDLSLDRVRAIAVALNLIHPGSCVILVGGTNGKGTTCCLLESILLHNNISVGLYTSPHLLSYNERIRVCGKELSDDIHVEALCAIENIRNNVQLTYFEFITLSALYIFKHKKLDVIILEVGLGGRLDATNVVDPDISVITNVAIDHVDLLGSTRELIAVEKSGIIRANKPIIIGEFDYPKVINKVVQYHASILFTRGNDWNFYVYGDRWCWWSHSRNILLFDLPLPLIPLENAATALGVLCWLPYYISKQSIYYGLQVATLPGRFQMVVDNPHVVLDVGHNPHAASYLVKILTNQYIRQSNSIIRMVIGMLKNKDVAGTIRYLNNFVKVWYCAALDTPLSTTPMQLSKNIISATSIQCFDNILDAWNKAMLDANFNDYIIVFGSFYAVSPIMKTMINDDYKY